MTPNSATIQPSNHPLIESSLKDYITLVKPGVLLLVVFSGAAGMLMAPVATHPFLQIVTLLCIAMGSASGAIFNMVYDQDIDRIMKRTQKRPLITGAIAAEDATLLAVFLAIFSVSLLGLATNWHAAGLLAFAIFFYAYIYTVLLKRHTPQNIVIGGAAGAFPPVIGWMAMTGSSDLLPWLLFALVFFWTPPHFWALALFRNEDYRRANVPMLPVVAGPKATSLQMLLYAILLLPLSLLIVAVAPHGGLFSGILLAALNLRFIHYGWQVHRTHDDKLSRKMFGYSILYLLLSFTVLLCEHFWVAHFV
jgi:protoheme IX farnesyltransferase